MAGKTTMTLGEAMRISLSSLWAHKMRSVLTLLGVVIGVMSVIAVVSIVNGLNRYVAEKVFNLGADVFMINRGPSIITNIEDYEEARSAGNSTWTITRRFATPAGAATTVGASINQSVGQVKYGTDYLSDSDILGLDAFECRRLYDLDLARGPAHQSKRRGARRAVFARGLRHRGQTAPGHRTPSARKSAWTPSRAR